MWIIKPAPRRPYTPIPNEAGPITSRGVLENPTDAQWPASNHRRYPEVIETHNQLSPYVDDFSCDQLLQSNHKT